MRSHIRTEHGQVRDHGGPAPKDDTLIHRAHSLAAGLAAGALSARTLCGQWITTHGADPDAPPCPECEAIADHKGWQPRQ